MAIIKFKCPKELKDKMDEIRNDENHVLYDCAEAHLIRTCLRIAIKHLEGQIKK